MPPPRRTAAPQDPARVSEAALHDAALGHLARYATTEAGLRRVLDRRIDRWARTNDGAAEAETISGTVAAARSAARAVVARLAAAGALSDAAFAASRARSLARAGRSRQAIAAHLAAKGVARETARAALPSEAETELAAALILARRRRIGPFRTAPADPADPMAARRDRGVLARAGFGQEVAEQALAYERIEAEALIARARAGA